jgi:hypothetical protein
MGLGLNSVLRSDTSSQEQSSGWIGVDFDGTLVEYYGADNLENIGDLVPAMYERIVKWLEEGTEVRIFTARAANPITRKQVEDYLAKVGLGGLMVTNLKDPGMIQLWDDRCVPVVPNKGVPLINCEVK